jgi:hypothetical protein
VAVALALPACPAEHGEAPPPDAAKRDDVVTDIPIDRAAQVASARIEPASAELIARVESAGTSQDFRVFLRASPGAPEEDVTAEAQFTVDDAQVATNAGARVTAGSRGGTARVDVLVRGATAQARVRVRLVGDVVPTGVDPALPGRFAAATDDPTPAAAPRIEYPLAGAVVPANVPPMEVQWTQAADNAVYRLVLSGDNLEVAVYGAARELTASRALWASVLASARDAALRFTVQALGPTGGRRASAPVTITVAPDRIDDSSIYYWESSSGSFKVLDFASGTNRALPTDSPTVTRAAAGGTCVACHTVSRDGRRYAYTTGAFNYGSLRLQNGDGGAARYGVAIEPGAAVTTGFRASHGAFNPLEAATRAALLLTTAPVVPNNTAGHVRLQLLDPDTGAEVPSDVGALIAALPASVGHDVLIPDWSDDGSRVVFSAYDSEAMGTTAGVGATRAHVRILTDDAVAASIVEATVRYDAKLRRFRFSDPRVLVQSPPDPSFDTRQNNVLPVYSPDAALVAFTRAEGWWPIRFQTDATNDTGRVALVRRSDLATVELARASGPARTDTTWPQWAPGTGTRYAWLAFSSARPYGHRMAPGVPLPSSCLPQGHSLCKQMWITAIDRRAAEQTPLVDPSAVPFWMPGQNATASAVSPRWTTRVIPPE